MRLIDADIVKGLIDLALVDTIDEEHRYTKTAQNIVSGAKLAKEAIDLAPTIEPTAHNNIDIVRVGIVQCKDCRYYNDGDCTEMPKLVGGDDFCSFGERRKP